MMTKTKSLGLIRLYLIALGLAVMVGLAATPGVARATDQDDADDAFLGMIAWRDGAQTDQSHMEDNYGLCEFYSPGGMRDIDAIYKKNADAIEQGTNPGAKLTVCQQNTLIAYIDDYLTHYANGKADRKAGNDFYSQGVSYEGSGNFQYNLANYKGATSYYNDASLQFGSASVKFESADVYFGGAGKALDNAEAAHALLLSAGY